MKILHLTDLHYRIDSAAKVEQEKLLHAICDNLKNEKIDLLLFTGDLVNTGNKFESFSQAKAEFLDPICACLGIEDRLFICAGNHDVHREQELHAIQSEFDKIKNSVELEQFLKSQNGMQYKESLKNLGNYLAFQSTFYKNNLDNKDEFDKVNDLFSIHKRTISGKKIGIATINTAWRSINSESDRGNLFYPISFLKDAIHSLKTDTDFRILLLHHPLSDLKHWNAAEAEDLIFNEFHMKFSGHVHKKQISTFITNDEGIFCCVSPATLSLFDNQSSLGFSILDLDLETYEIAIHNRLYERNQGVFYELKSPQLADIPLNGNKRDQNDFRKTLRKIREMEVERANDLFISSNENESARPFLDLFTSPILKAKSKAEIAKDHENTPNMSLEELALSRECFVVLGKDKSGRTSLLYKILLDLLKEFSIHKIIPFYLDCRNYRRADKPINFSALLAQYFQMNKSKFEEFTLKYHFKLLLDNYDPSNLYFNGQLNAYLDKHKNFSFIASTEETISRTFDGFDFGGIQYKTMFLHEIGRPEIRTLTNKWPSIPSSRKEQIIDKITQIFSQLNMPMNYWTVSLFLWIFEKTSEANFHNNFELIQLYVDNLLDRRRLALDKSIKIDYDDFRSYLGELAHHLITKNKDSVYSADYTEIVRFTEEYRKKNRRFVIPVQDIVDLIIERGILKKTFENRFTFRLNGVFEYFLAYYMKDNPDFRDGIITDNHYYLSFSNELELCSGFNKKDKEFLELVYNKTKLIYETISTKYDAIGTKDEVLLQKIYTAFDITAPLKQLTSGKKNILSPEKQDNLIEEFSPLETKNVDVVEKKFYNEIEITSENLEKALFILARVFRNSAVNDDNFNNAVFDFILDSACDLGFLMIDETNQEDEENKTDISNEVDEKLLMKLVTNFMPLLVQVFLFDAIAQNNLERIILEKIDELKKDKSNNQFKLLILYFILIDLDLKANKRYIDDVIDLMRHGVLKQTTIVKLYTYLIFKSHGHPELEQYLRDKIQKQTLKINDQVDLKHLHQGLEKNKKMIQLRNRKKR